MNANSQNKNLSTEKIAQHYEDVIEKINNKNRFGGQNGIYVTELSEGMAKGQMKVTERLLNPHGAVHGGALSTLGDVVAGMAVVTAGYNCVTLNCSINYLKEVRQGTVYCEAEIVKLGRTITVCDVTLTDDNDRKIATGTYSFFSTGTIEDLIN